MPPRLVALDDGADIILDRAMVVIGRHPQCDARLDSLRVSRHHCCMSIDQGTVLVRDLGSTNGIRINGHRVEFGRLHDGDELSRIFATGFPTEWFTKRLWPILPPRATGMIVGRLAPH